MVGKADALGELTRQRDRKKNQGGEEKIMTEKRKKATKAGKFERCSYNLERRQVARLRKVQQETGVSASFQVRKALEQYWRKDKSGS